MIALGEDLSSQTATSDNNFWLLSQQLVQEEVYLVGRIERALQEPDPNQVRAVRGQLTLHVFAVERFLKTTPDVCNSTLAGMNTSLQPQMRVYCSLSASSQQLLALAPMLDRQLQARGDLAPVRPLPLVSGERQPDAVLPMSVVQRPNLGVPATPFFAPAPIPAADPPLVGRIAKTLIAGYVPPMQPAIAPPSEALSAIQSIKQLLSSAKAAFPPGTQFVAALETPTGSTYLARQASQYAGFLALPHTGITQVWPADVYRPPNTLHNRLVPTMAERLPFAPSIQAEGVRSQVGTTQTAVPTPRLALKIASGNFQILESGVDYGFLVDLSDVPLEKLDSRLQVVSPQTRQFFLTYQPPQQLEALQVDRRRFLTGKLDGFGLSQAILSQAPAAIGHTYLVRSLQFQLPEVIMTGEPVSRRERRYLDQLLEMKSSDFLFAFRPISLNRDGSYTVLWRVLNQFPNPKIADLEKYIRLE